MSEIEVEGMTHVADEPDPLWGRIQAKRDELAKEKASYEEAIKNLNTMLRRHQDVLLVATGALKALDELLAP